MEFIQWLKQAGFGQWLYDWQTLVAGFLALGGAYWAIRGIREQIAHTEGLEERRRARDEYAAKAVLPLALSALSQYARDCIRTIDPYVPKPGHPTDNIQADTQLPKLEDSVIGVLQECVRYADNERATQIAILLGKFQVQNSRIRDLFIRRVGHPLILHEGVEAMLDAADIYARVDELYDYGRRIEEIRRRTTANQLRTALRLSGFHEDAHPAHVRVAELAQAETQ